MREANMRRALGIAWPLAVGAALAACGGPSPGGRTFITIATGGTGGVYYPLGGALAQIYTATIPGVNASAQSTVASVFNVQAIQQGKADVAFTQGDVATLAYEKGTEADPTPHANLRGMAVLYVNTVQIVVRRDSDIRSVADFRGRRVGVGAPASGTEVAARVVIEAHGLDYGDVGRDYLSFSEVAAQMQDRTLDGGFIVASYPVSAITDASMTVGVRLLSLDRGAVERIETAYPFFRPVVIPAGTYRDQSEEVATIGVDNLLVCRAGLPDDLVYEMTRVLFDALPRLAETHAAAGGVDPARTPIMSIPLHPGAERYYRERGLLK